MKRKMQFYPGRMVAGHLPGENMAIGDFPVLLQASPLRLSFSRCETLVLWKEIGSSPQIWLLLKHSQIVFPLPYSA